MGEGAKEWKFPYGRVLIALFGLWVLSKCSEAPAPVYQRGWVAGMKDDKAEDIQSAFDDNEIFANQIYGSGGQVVGKIARVSTSFSGAPMIQIEAGRARELNLSFGESEAGLAATLRPGMKGRFQCLKFVRAVGLVNGTDCIIEPLPAFYTPKSKQH